jgi:hypothetical protein
VRAEPGEGVLEVVDGEHDAVHAQRVRRDDLRIGGDRLRGVVLRQLEPARAPGIRIIAISLRMSSSPTTFPAQLPSIGILPSNSMPSSVKKATAASRSSTTMPTLSMR